MQTVATGARIKLPPELAICPICGAEVVIEDILEYEKNDDGTWQASESGLHINCITEPEIGSDAWQSWFDWHWAMPYVDWLPLSIKVFRWMSANYRFEMDRT